MEQITTVSGLQYEDKVIGEGAEAQAGNNVDVHYTGWLQNPDGSAGKKFDSSKDRGTPFSFGLGAASLVALHRQQVYAKYLQVRVLYMQRDDP